MDDKFDKLPPVEYFTSNPKGHLLEKHVKNNFPEFYKILMKFPADLKFAERIYWYYNGIDTKPLCPICKKSHPKFISFGEGYLQYCSFNCSVKSTTRVEKIKKTNLKKYGVENVSQSDKIKDKKKHTLQEHYGVDIPLQSSVIQNRQQNTLMEKYGVKNISQNESIKIKKLKRKHLTIINSNENIIDIRNGIYMIKCPHPECTVCEEKYFEIPISRYSGRIYDKTEPCTKLLPIQFNRLSNTSIELFVQNILTDNNIEYIANERKILSGKELDIYIPSKKLAIECNGIYWHSLKGHYYHYDKWNECKKHGIQLLTVWEDQIINKPDIIRGIIESKLGIYDIRIPARSCIIKKVPSNVVIEFLDKNHLQGAINGSLRLGLYYNGELISLMVFGKKRKALGSKHEDNTWELYRYCSRVGTQVIGGAERIFKHFLIDHYGCNVESFSSNDISNGDLYKKLGFEFMGEQKGTYWYIDKEMHRHHRFSFRKDVLVRNGADPEKTEFQITDEMGLYRIYDSGQQKWLYKKPS